MKSFSGSLPGDFDTTVNPGGQNGNFPFGPGGANGGGSGATGFPTGGAAFDEGPNGGFGGNGGGGGGQGTQFGGGNGVSGPGSDFGIGGNGFGQNGGGGFPGGLPGGPDDADNVVDTGDSDDVNCDYLGTCYDGRINFGNITNIFNDVFTVVSVHCKDTRIVVNVGTNKPFSGRIYALGRSETCNVDVINSDTFR